MYGLLARTSSFYISEAANWPTERQSMDLSPLFHEDAQDAQDAQAIN
jgi:hypothetical protein